MSATQISLHHPRKPAEWPWGVCLLLLGATALSYLDRQALSVVAPIVGAEFALDNAQLGVVVTFLPTLAPTTELLKNAAAEAGVTVELSPCVVDEAYAALLGGDPERHDALVLDAIRILEGRDLDSIVPAQVSMARLLPKIEGRVRIPCLSSLPASLEAVRRSLP